MDAVAISLVSGVLFALLTVLVRRSVVNHADPPAGSFAMLVLATAGALVAAAAAGELGAVPSLPGGPLFLALGMVAPGVTQLALTQASKDVGASRTSIMLGTVPMLSVFLAVVVRGEAFSAGLGLGIALIVVGSASLAWERELPEGFRARGMALAFAAALLFAFRDNGIRMLEQGVADAPLAGASWTLAGAALTAGLFTLATARADAPRRARAAFRPFLLAGLVYGVAYTTLVLALHVARVGVFSPLNATQSMWAVLFAWLILRRGDGIEPRVVVAGALVVAGGVLIGVVR